MRDVLIRIVCAFIPNKQVRKRIRKRLLENNKHTKLLKKLDRIQGAMTDSNGMGMLSLMLDNANVLERHRFIFQKMRKGDVCIDCGANVGLITDIMRFMDATVYSFEPHPDLFSFLKQKYKVDSNVYLFNEAVWDKQSELELQIPKNHANYLSRTVGSTLFTNPILQNDFDRVKTPVIDLTEFIENTLLKKHEEIYLLKIDIEGAEYELLEKIIKHKIYKKVKYLVCETHTNIIPNGKMRIKQIEKLIHKDNIDNIFLDWN